MLSRPVQRHRFALFMALGAAALAGLYVHLYYARTGLWSDVDQIWIGARALLAGDEPYAAVLAGFPWPLYYPLPSLLLGMPLAPFPLEWARVVFAATTMGVCTYVVARCRPHLLPTLATGPWLYAVERGQWGPLLVTAAIVPWLGALLVAKPSSGLAVFAFKPTRSAVVGAGALVLASLMVQPSWPLHWVRAFEGARHLLAPVTLFGGWTLLFALRRWRDPGARLLAVLAFAPITVTLYELCVLTLIPQNNRRAWILAALFNVLYLLTQGRDANPPFSPAEIPIPYEPLTWPYMFLFGYLPALVMVLWPPGKSAHVPGNSSREGAEHLEPVTQLSGISDSSPARTD